MVKKKLRFSSFVLAIVILLSAMPFLPAYAEDSSLSTDVTCPFTSSVQFTLPDGTATGSNSFRIPSMVTLKDGTIVAAADIRWNTTYDGGGLDTLVARSSDGGVSWSYVTANYLGDNGNVYNGSSSTAFIDPCLTVAADGQTVYMLCDLYPYGIALNGSGNTQPSAAVGFTDDGYLKLSDDNHSSYSYYLKDGQIYNSVGTAITGYTVDSYFNLYLEGRCVGNLFYSDSPYKVVRTGFLYLTSSKDGGATWSAPTLLNLKTSSEQVCLVGPGRGITTSDGTMIFPVYSYSGSSNSQRMGFIYSADGTNWSRVDSIVSWSSEAAVVEIGEGVLRFFYRNGTTNLCYVDYKKGDGWSDGTWGSYVNTGVDTNSNTQLSAITYSKKTSDGKQVVLVSCPTGPNCAGSDNNNGGYRLNGYIFTGTVISDGSMTWAKAIQVTPNIASSYDSASPYTEDEGFFAYSSLTERSDGSVAILYENRENAWGAGDSCYYTMNMKAYSASALGITFASDGGDTGGEGGGSGGTDITDEPSNVISAGGVTLTSSQVLFTKLTVTEGTAPTADFINRAVSYNVIPESANGVYTGSANVTLAIPDTWDSAKVFGFVKEADASITVLPGTASNGSFTFTCPHFSEIGLFEASDFALVNGQTVTLEVGESSGAITVISLGSLNQSISGITDDGAVSYKVDYVPASTKVDYAVADVTCNDLISSNSTSWAKAGEYYYTPDGTNYYPVYAKRSETYYYWYTYTWGCSVTDSASDVTQIKTQDWASTSSTPNITVYTKGTETTIPASASVTFTGLDVTPGTEIAIGGTTYTVIVNAKTAEKPTSLQINTSTTLDALADLGLSGNYTAEYTTDSTLITLQGATVTAGTAVGEATVVATVKSAKGNVVGTVNYTVTVSDVVVNDVKNIYVATNGTATIEGLSGEIYTAMLDTEVATISPVSGTLNNGTVTINGGANEGKTAVVIGTTQFNIYVVPENEDRPNASTYIYVNITAIDNCTVYYAINGGVLYEVEGLGVLVDQTFLGGFNLMFFAKPDEGYALTEMIVVKSAGNYYSLSDGTRADGSDSTAWPFWDPDPSAIPSSSDDSAWKVVNGAKHGFRWCLLEGNMSIDEMRDLFARAIALGCDGATTFTKNNSGEQYETDAYFKAEKLPTLDKSIVSYQRDGVTYPYSEGNTTLEFGDVVTYKFTVTTYSSNVQYTNITLKDERIGYTNTSIPDGTFNTSGQTLEYTATYTISADDIDKYVNGSFLNEATLEYTYQTSYSNGTNNAKASASVSCKINGIVHYSWMEGLPAGITGDSATYPLPQSESVTYGEPITVKGGPYTDFDVKGENGVTVGTWSFLYWEYDGSQYTVGDKLTMPQDSSVEFVGIWKYTDKLTTLTVKKEGYESIDLNQTFIFRITGDAVDLTVTVHGNSSVTVSGLTAGKSYTVTELNEWSWRYGLEKWSFTDGNSSTDGTNNEAQITLGAGENVITFANKRLYDKWLDGDAYKVNTFKNNEG